MDNPITSEAVWAKLNQDPIFLARPREMRDRIKAIIAPLLASILAKFPEDQKVNGMTIRQCRNIYTRKNFENACTTSNIYAANPDKKEMMLKMLEHNEEELANVDYSPQGAEITEEEFAQIDLKAITPELSPEALVVYQAGNLTIRELLLNFPFSLFPSLNPFFRQ